MALTIGAMTQGELPANPQAKGDSDLGITLMTEPMTAAAGYYLFNCFAFGGNNNSLIVRDCGQTEITR